MRIVVQSHPRQIFETLSQKYPARKRVAQVVESLPSKCEVLISNHNTTERKKKSGKIA
jgi:hypothetical protein